MDDILDIVTMWASVSWPSYPYKEMALECIGLQVAFLYIFFGFLIIFSSFFCPFFFGLLKFNLNTKFELFHSGNFDIFSIKTEPQGNK